MPETGEANIRLTGLYVSVRDHRRHSDPAQDYFNSTAFFVNRCSPDSYRIQYTPAAISVP